MDIVLDFLKLYRLFFNPKPDGYIKMHSWVAGDTYDILVTNRKKEVSHHALAIVGVSDVSLRKN
jgi:hypothetical protein